MKKLLLLLGITLLTVTFVQAQCCGGGDCKKGNSTSTGNCTGNSTQK